MRLTTVGVVNAATITGDLTLFEGTDVHNEVDITWELEITDSGSYDYFTIFNEGSGGIVGSIHFEDTVQSIGWDNTDDVNMKYVNGNGNLAGGNNLDPSFDASFALSKNGSIANGIDVNEELKIYILKDDYEEDFRVGIHMQSLSDGSSASYVASTDTPTATAAVPEPTASLFLGLTTLVTLLRRSR